jgi:membrane protein CcdC involved in cytochrome C biogenesis
VQTAAQIRIPTWRGSSASYNRSRTGVFVFTLGICVLLSLILSTWLPLQVSVVTVFLFAGPHNWFELRYFLSRLPLRFGKSRSFFLTAFAGIGILTALYISLPLIVGLASGTQEGWSIVIASWNSLLLVWVGLLIWLRSRQKTKSDWTWVAPILLAAGALNWLAPMFFSLAIVYLHPLVALWFLDRHLARTRPQWLRAYRRFLYLLPILVGMMVWRLSQTPPLPDDNGLFWRITQHSGAELFPWLSSHMLVSVHLFLEMLHYGVWVIALPLIVPLASTGERKKIWDAKSVPLARHPRGFPRLIAGFLIIAAFFVVVLWLGFSLDYGTTRDVYFTVAIAHVLAEAPFLLRML